MRIGVGGARERQWHGDVSIDQGTISLVRPLGILADSPGSIWASSDSTIEIRQRSPRAYDGFDLAINAPLNGTKLKIRLAAEGDAEPVTFEIALTDLATMMQRRQLDKQENQLLVRRSPGDMLRVETDHDPLIFSPGETWKINVRPRLLPVAAGTTVYLKSRLVAARGGAEQWSKDDTFKAPAADAAGAAEQVEAAAIPLEVKLPDVEGAYDLVLEATERGPLRWPKSITERRVQVLVLADHAPLPTADSPGWTQVLEIDPANPRWYDRFKALPRLQSMIPGKDPNPAAIGPLGNGTAQAIGHPLGRLMQLGSGGREPNISWEAYPLSVAKIGAPHILEVEYPSDVVQTLGISVIEPNAAGARSPSIELDSPAAIVRSHSRVPSIGLSIGSHSGRAPRAPRSCVAYQSPRRHTSTCHGKLRLYCGPGAAARRIPGRGAAGAVVGRLSRAAVVRGKFLGERITRRLHRPQPHRLADVLRRRDADGRLSQLRRLQRPDDGRARRGEQHLSEQVAGADAAIPTRSKAFLDQGHDPFRQKDALEATFRVFDRENLKLIPTLHHSR